MGGWVSVCQRIDVRGRERHKEKSGQKNERWSKNGNLTSAHKKGTMRQPKKKRRKKVVNSNGKGLMTWDCAMG